MIQMKFKYVSKKKLLQSRQFISYDKYEVYTEKATKFDVRKAMRCLLFDIL